MAAALAVVRPHGITKENLFGKDINLYTGRDYRLYTRGPNQKKFSPLDCKRGVQVHNLIYATIVAPKTLDDLKTMRDAVNYVRSDNPGWAAEWREVK